MSSHTRCTGAASHPALVQDSGARSDAGSAVISDLLPQRRARASHRRFPYDGFWLALGSWDLSGILSSAAGASQTLDAEAWSASEQFRGVSGQTHRIVVTASTWWLPHRTVCASGGIVQDRCERCETRVRTVQARYVFNSRHRGVFWIVPLVTVALVLPSLEVLWLPLQRVK